MSRQSKLLAALGGGILSTTIAGNALALEGGQSVYPMGAENYLVGALPPPGTYFLDYTLFYSASRFNGNNGQKLFPSFHLDAFVEAPRVLHTFDTPILGATPFVAALAAFEHEDVSVNQGAGFANGYDTGVFEADLTQGLGWHLTPTSHFALGVDEFIPVGYYDPAKVANASLHRYAIEPIAAYTYFDPTGFTVNIKAMYDFNLNNSATNYQSGQDFHFDYAAGYNVGAFTLGVGGYYEHQTTKDYQNGVVAGPGGDGFMSQGFALGPDIQYSFDHNIIRFKWQHEFVADNKPQGEMFWISAVVPLGGPPPAAVVARY